MKLYKKLTNKILKFYLLKCEVNEKKNFLSESTVSSLLSNIRKILFLILQFHKSEKRIMFIGLTSNTQKLVSSYTNHMTLNSNTDLKDFVSKGFYLKSLENGKVATSNSLNHRSRPDLLIVLSHYQKKILLNECSRLKIPFAHYNSYSGFFEINSVIEKSVIVDDSVNNIFFFEICLVFLIKKSFNYSALYKSKW